MNFDLSDDQREIARAARELLAERSSFARVRVAAEGAGSDEALWAEMVELGWTAIGIAEEDGGAGLGSVELAVLAEQLGYAVAPTRFLGNALAGLVISGSGSTEQRRRLLPPLAGGEASGAVGLVRDGVAELVPDAVGAGLVVLVDGDRATVAEAAELSIEPVATIDPTRTYARVIANGGEVLDMPATAPLDRCEVVLAAELVGVAQRALEMTVAYVKQRRQFGQPVGAFQAVSHRCAQMLLDVEGARSAVYAAAWAADADPEQLPFAASVAKAAAADAGRHVTASAIQAHGGIGFTWEADVHWLFKRAHVDAALLRSARWHRARIARLAAGLEREPQPLAQR
jgi:alkylation response protein AidB-like acyl-CoA dehydrogenase